MPVPHRAHSAVLFVVCLSCVSLAASAARVRDQQPIPSFPGPPRDGGPAPPARAGTSAIRGVVTSAGQPVADARVTLSGGRPGAPRTATTDDRGHFLIASLPAGQYMVNASKTGHVNVSWGQRRYGGMGRPLPLGDGATREITLDLPRAGVITGTVVNERGEPVVNTSVQALQLAFMNGQRVPRPAGASQTDDRGIYRIHSLQPGEYIVCTSPMNHDVGNERQMLRRNLEAMRRAPANPATVPEAARQQMAERIAQLEAQLAATPQEPIRGYAPVCVPGPTLAYGGIPIAPGEERAAVDLQQQRIELASIEGRILLPPGVSLPDLSVTMLRRGETLPVAGGGHMPNTEESDGVVRWMRDDLVPGEYRIEVRTRTMPLGGRGQFGGAAPLPEAASKVPRLWAAVDVTLEPGNTTELALDLQPALSISGVLVFDGSSAPPADVARAEVIASPVMPPMVLRPMLAEQARGTVDATGRFTIAGVFPGTYRLSSTLAGWMPKSIVVGHQDALDVPVEIGAGRPVTGVVITLTDRTQELSGTIVDDRGAPVSEHSLILFPSDERYWIPGSRRIRMMRPDADGTFVYRSVPLGDYRVAAVLDFDPGEVSSPEFLRQLAWTSTRVSLGEGEKKSISLRVRADH